MKIKYLYLFSLSITFLVVLITSITILYNLFSKALIEDNDVSIMATGLLSNSVFYGLYVSIEKKTVNPKFLKGIARFIQCFFSCQCLGFIGIIITNPILMESNSLLRVIFSAFMVLLALVTLFVSTEDLKCGKFFSIE